MTTRRDNIRIYVTGGNSRLARNLLDLIPNATPLTRKPMEGAIQTDYSYEELKYILSDADVVFHLAGMIHGNKKELYESNVLLTEELVNALPDKARLIFASSISVYGKKLIEKPANEETPLNPDTPYAKAKAEAEEVAGAHRDTIIMRIATLYGENFVEYFKLFKLIENKKAPIFGSGKNKLPLTYARDVAKAMKNSIKKGKGVYVVSAPSEEQEKLMKKASLLLGAEFKPFRIGFVKALALAKINSFIGFSSILKEETVHSLSADREFSSFKAEKEIGFNPIHPLKGINIMVNHYKNKYKKSIGYR